jgi:RNA polymerase sigma-70 factor (ECF subfamily)
VTEDELLAAARRGDHRAFAGLLDVYDRPLRALAFRILDDREDMDDAMQEAAVKAFVNLDSFDGRSSFGTWLYRITYTTCLNQLRSRRPAPAPLDEERALRRPTTDPATDVDERLTVEGALRSLSPEQRATVCLVLELGYSLAEAAGVLQVPVGTVSSRLWHARAALQRSLEAPSTTGRAGRP